MAIHAVIRPLGHLLIAIAAIVEVDVASAQAGDDPVERLRQVWNKQSSEIHSASIRFKLWRVAGGLVPLTATEVEEVFARADLANHPEQFGDVIAKLSTRPPLSKSPWRVLRFSEAGDARSMRDDSGDVVVIKDENDLEFSAKNRHATLQARGASRRYVERLRDFRWLPSLKPNIYTFSSSKGGIVHLTADGGDFYFDEASGLLSRMVVRNSSGTVTRLLLQSGFVEYPEGIIFPSLMVNSDFGPDGSMSFISVTLVEEARFNEDLAPKEFDISVPAGSTVLDVRQPERVRTRQVPRAVQDVDTWLTEREGGSNLEADSRSWRATISVACLAVILLVVGVLMLRRRSRRQARE